MHYFFKHFRVIGCGLWLLAGVLASTVRGDVLSDNLENATGGVEAANATRWLGASFSTNAVNWRLSSVTLHLSNPITGTAVLELHGNGGLQPGALVATLNSPATYPAALADVTFTASNITPFSTTSVSRLEIDCSMRRPRPGRTNTFSTTIAPAMRFANCSPMMVRMGVSAFGRAWRRRAARRPTPLARAVRM